MIIDLLSGRNFWSLRLLNSKWQKSDFLVYWFKIFSFEGVCSVRHSYVDLIGVLNPVEFVTVVDCLTFILCRR